MGDVGIYCLNACRYVTGEEPTEVVAMAHQPSEDPRFAEVPASVTFQLRFPSGVLANCTSSYGYSGQNKYRVIATKGWFELEPATSYTGLRMKIRRNNATEDRDLVDSRLFGLGRERYAQLLDLLLALRRPLLAKDLDPAKVSDTLTSGLSPVDEYLVQQKGQVRYEFHDLLRAFARRKLADDAHRPRYIETIVSVGYRLSTERKG